MADDRVKQVKQANDIVEVVGSYLALRPAGPTFLGLCPFHNDRRPSFDVDPRRQRYRCWACGKHGDVLSFVQEFEKLSFREALLSLARRVGLSWEEQDLNPQQQHRALLLDVVRWAAQQYHTCLLEDEQAEAARTYLGNRQLLGETVRKYGLGYAPRAGDWLCSRAKASRVPLEALEQAGLIALRQGGEGHYDRFRDRVLFPIREIRGQTVGFGGRLMPDSPLGATGAPKYYNSTDTPLFSKSEQLYGIDVARYAAEKTGYLAVVEGYTDVLMAHQMGLQAVVATMGTALNGRHVQQLRRFASRVVLVFDADAGGVTGVKRALELFVSHDVSLAIATLPEGLDPYDLLVREGPDPLARALEAAVDALEFSLQQVLLGLDFTDVAARQQAVDSVLRVIALAPTGTGVGSGSSQANSIKVQLMINRIAQRLALKEETVWARLEELRNQRRGEALRSRSHGPGGMGGMGGDPGIGSLGGPGGPLGDTDTDERVGSAHSAYPAYPARSIHSNDSTYSVSSGSTTRSSSRPSGPSAKALPEERQLLEMLLADPDLVPVAWPAIKPEEIEHPGLRRLLAGLYSLYEDGEVPSLDALRLLLDHPRLCEAAFSLQEIGLAVLDRPVRLGQLLEVFQERRARSLKQELQNQLQATQDHARALELLQKLCRVQNRSVELGPDATACSSVGPSAGGTTATGSPSGTDPAPAGVRS